MNGTTSETRMPLPVEETAEFSRGREEAAHGLASGTPRPSNGAGVRIEIVNTREGVEKLRPFWKKFNEHPDADIDFFSLIVSSRTEVISPYVLVAMQGDEPRAILIGRLENTHIRYRAAYLTLGKLKVRQISILQEGFLGDHGPEMAHAMVEQIKQDLKKGVADVAMFYNVDIGSDLRSLARSMPSVWVRDRSREVAERWRTSLPASLEEFLKRRSKKHRYWLKRIGRVFEEAHPGQVKYRVLSGTKDVAELCAIAEKVARKTYQRGLGVGFMNHSEDRWRLELAAEKGWLRSYAVTLNDEPIAFWCGRFYKDVMYLDWTGYDPAYRKYELGTVLFLKMVEDLCRSGATEMDYGAGGSFYKERFGDNHAVREVVSIYAPGIKGLFAGNLKSIESIANKKAKSVVEKLKIKDRIKKGWRGLLARFAARDAEPAGQTKSAEVAEAAKD